MIAEGTKTGPADHEAISSHIVYLKGVTVEFDGFKALNISEFGVHFNDLRVVIGPNGAGKTTMCDVISGKTRAKTGNVYFDRTEVTRMPDVEIARRGVGRKFQTPTVFDSLTVYENMELALPGRRNIWRNLVGPRRRRSGIESLRSSSASICSTIRTARPSFSAMVSGNGWRSAC